MTYNELWPIVKKTNTMDSDKKIDDYKSRQKEWRDLSLNQLSTVNNVFATLAIGFLAYIFKPDLFLNISVSIFKPELKPTMISYSLFVLIVSIIFGLLVLLTRLYDFRISRHLALTRQRTMEHYKSAKGLLPENKRRPVNTCHRLGVFFRIVFCKIDYISKQEIEKLDKSTIKKRFQKLQRLSDILGSATWRWLKIQILFFLLSIVFYVIYLIR